MSLSTRNSLSYYLTAQAGVRAGGSNTSATVNANANVKARIAATTEAALQTAGGSHQASAAGRALDKQQTILAGDLRAAMTRSGVKLTGTIEFSVKSDGKVGTKGSDADKAAMAAFLKSDTSRLSFATRIATQAQAALRVSATIQQHAAVSQAARYGGNPGGVMSLYTSLTQQESTSAAVFTFAAGSSSLSYPGSLATKA